MIDDDVIVILKNVILKTFKITKSLIWEISLQSSKKKTFSWRRVRHSKSGAEHKAMMEVVCLVADNDDAGDDDDGGGFQTQVEVNLGLVNNTQVSYQNTHRKG